VLCWPTFPLVSVLGSTGSAADRSALFVGFPATYDGVRLLGLVHHRLRLLAFPVRACSVHPQAEPETSRFPCKELPHMPGSLTTPGGMALAYRASHIAFRVIKRVGSRIEKTFRGSMAGLCAPVPNYGMMFLRPVEIAAGDGTVEKRMWFPVDAKLLAIAKNVAQKTMLKDDTGHRFDRRCRPARRSKARASRRARAGAWP
jgi:hypothetical protein